MAKRTNDDVITAIIWALIVGVLVWGSVFIGRASTELLLESLK